MSSLKICKTSPRIFWLSRLRREGSQVQQNQPCRRQRGKFFRNSCRRWLLSRLLRLGPARKKKMISHQWIKSTNAQRFQWKKSLRSEESIEQSPSLILSLESRFQRKRRCWSRIKFGKWNSNRLEVLRQERKRIRLRKSSQMWSGRIRNPKGRWQRAQEL